MINPSKPSRHRTRACLVAPFIVLGSLLLAGWAGGQLCYRTLLATPAPLPSIPGARLLTTDLALYTNLAWSPSGKYLAATRNQILSGAVSRFFPPSVLIDIESGNTIPIDFTDFTPYSIIFWAHFWASDSDRLLLNVREYIPPNPPTDEQQQHLLSEHYIFDIADNSLDALLLPSRTTALGWHKHNPNLLLIWQWVSEDGAQPGAYAWYSIDSGEMIDIFPDEENRHPTQLSDDGTKVLNSVLDTAGYCGDIYAHPIDTTEGFRLLLPSACGVTWSRDGNRMAYTSYADDPQQNYAQARLILANGDGSNPQPFFADENLAGFYSVAWSPDGKQLAFSFHSGQSLDKDYATGIYIANVPAEWQP